MMTTPRMTFASRRARNVTLLAAATLLLLGGFFVYCLKLRSGVLPTGWLLLAMMAFLTSYNLRKKVPALPLGSSAAWLQWHVYVGLLTAPLFVIHGLYHPRTGWHVPAGPFQFLLALLYVLTFATGLLGIFLTRELPARLTVRGEEVLYERIPIYLRELRERSEDLIVRSVGESDATTLSDFYTNRLVGFFAAPRHFWRHLVQSRRPARRLELELRALDRYLNPREREMAAELAMLIAKKDDLDYAWALQGALKGWLVWHVVFTYGLAAFVAVHVVMAYAFYGGVR